MIFYAKNAQEALFHIKNVANLKIVGGLTGEEEVGTHLLSASTIPELCNITRDERNINFGVGASLESALRLGEKRFPSLLFRALSSVANPFVRSRATISGNIMARKGSRTLLAPLLALKASLKFQDAKGSFIVPLSKFTGIKKGAILTSIQVPLEEYEISVFRSIKIDETSPSFTFAFALSLEKSVIRKVASVSSARHLFISGELVRLLTGKILPLKEEEAHNFFVQAEEEAERQDIFSREEKQVYFHLIKSALYELT